MPVIEVNLEDFLTLLGKDIPLEQIEDRLPLIGVSYEGRTEDGFSIEVFPNRPDMLSIEGLARAYASFTGVRTGLIPYEAKASDYVAVVEERVEPVRPYFVSAVIRNIEFDDPLIRSIIQMQEKLHITHCRKRRKVSIGLHNLKPIEFPVVYTARPPSFSFRPLGERTTMNLAEILTELPKGKEYAWVLEGKEEYPILMDSKGMVLSMPPIINSEHTRIDEATDSIFVDVTATDWKAMNEVLNIIVTTFADRGTEIYAVENHYPDRDVTTPDLSPRIMELENRYVNETLGLELTLKETAGYLEKMGYGIPAENLMATGLRDGSLTVQLPCYRTDIMHSYDLVEDVAIAYGYDRFVPEIPAIASPAGEDPLEVFCRVIRNFMVGFGFQETMTFMMTNRKNIFERMCLPVEPVAETENPKTLEYTVLRNRLLPSLMEVLSVNKHHPYPQNLFELGDVILLDEEDETGARTAKQLAIALCHSRANFSEAKSIMNSVLDNIDLKGMEVEPSGLSCFIEGRRLMAKVDGRPICQAGELRPEALKQWGLEMPVAGLEIDVDALFELTRSEAG